MGLFGMFGGEKKKLEAELAQIQASNAQLEQAIRNATAQLSGEGAADTAPAQEPEPAATDTEPPAPVSTANPEKPKKQKTKSGKKPKNPGITPRINLARTDGEKPIQGRAAPEGKPKTPPEQQPWTPRERLDLFIKKYSLENLLPADFDDLNLYQQLRVMQDLKRRMVDIVKSDAQTIYSDQIKGKSRLGGVLSDTLAKSRNMDTLEKEVFRKLTNTSEGKELLRKELEVLVNKNRDRNVYVDENGVVEIEFQYPNMLGNGEGAAAFETFNKVANRFINMPYEWGQENSGKRKKQYDQIKASYEAARNEILEIKKQYEAPGENGKAILEVMELDNAIQLEQILNTHPEFEQVFMELAKNERGKGFWKDMGRVLNTVTGKNLINRALMAAGFGGRALARGAAFITGVTGITLLGSVIVGGGVGAARGFFRGEQTLKEKKREARYGSYEASKESRVAITDASDLSRRLDKLISDVESAPDDDTRSKKLGLLATRIEHTRGKIEKGEVNFGDAKEILQNQYSLVNNLNKAIALKETWSDDASAQAKERVDRLLGIVAKNVAEGTAAAQDKFVMKQMWKGMAVGASFALGGYTLRWVGEHFGWWEWIDKKFNMPWEKYGVETPRKATVVPSTPEHADTVAPTETAATGITPPVTETHIPPQAQEVTPPVTETTPHVTETQVTPEQIPSVTTTEPPVDTHVTPEPVTPQQPPTVTQVPVEAPVTPDKFTPVEVRGKDAIEGIKELRAQIRARYSGDYSTAPQKVQEFMKETPVKQAIRLGLYDPTKVKESALVYDDTVLKFDNEGNLHFGRPDANGNIPTLEKYEGKMLDTDKVGATIKTGPETTAEEDVALQQPAETPTGPHSAVEEAGTTTPQEETVPDGRETVAEERRIHREDSSEVEERVREQVRRGYRESAGEQMRTGQTMRVGDRLEPGDIILDQNGQPIRVTGADAAGQINYEYGPGDPNLGHNVFSSGEKIFIRTPHGTFEYFSRLTPEENYLIHDHPAFAGNVYGLDGPRLLDTFKMATRHLGFIFKDEFSPDWHTAKKLSSLRILEYYNDGDPSVYSQAEKFADYMRALRGYVRETIGEDYEPRRMGILRRPENAEQYMARLLQKLALKNKLEDFEATLR